MADIAIITVDDGAAPGTRIAASLTTSGHTVTIVEDADYATANLGTYDVIMTVRCELGESDMLAIRALGVPMIICGSGGRDGDPVALRLWEDSGAVAMGRYINNVNDHEINAG